MDPVDQLLCQENLDARSLLSAASADDLSSFCAGIVLTARDFADGTMGLAWPASPSTAGGYCETRRFSPTYNKLMSFNSAIVTVVSFGQRVAEPVSQITLAHEMGHSFGAQHDTKGACAPGNTRGGNFIMYYR